MWLIGEKLVYLCDKKIVWLWILIAINVVSTLPTDQQFTDSTLAPVLCSIDQLIQINHDVYEDQHHITWSE